MGQEHRTMTTDITSLKLFSRLFCMPSSFWCSIIKYQFSQCIVTLYKMWMLLVFHRFYHVWQTAFSYLEKQKLHGLLDLFIFFIFRPLHFWTLLLLVSFSLLKPTLHGKDLSAAGLFINCVCISAGFHFLFPLLFTLKTQRLSLVIWTSFVHKGGIQKKQCSHCQFLQLSQCDQYIDLFMERLDLGHMLDDVKKLTYCSFGCQTFSQAAVPPPSPLRTIIYDD